jgi:predicted phosphodiesterase
MVLAETISLDTSGGDLVRILTLKDVGKSAREIAAQVYPEMWHGNQGSAERKVRRRLAEYYSTPNPEQLCAPVSLRPSWVEQEKTRKPVLRDYGLPDAAPLANTWLKLMGDRLVISDLHIPYHDNRVLEAAFRTAERLGLRRFLILGDTLDNPQWHKRNAHLGFQRRYQDDVVAAEGVFKALLGVFEGGEVISGNHDRYWEDHMKGHLDPEFVLPRLFGTPDRIAFTRYEQCELVSGGELFRLCHGANYSAGNPLSVPQKLATKFGCHVVTAHQHHRAEGRDASGRYQAVTLGCAADPDRLAYLHVSPRTNPAQTQGYAVVKDGFCRAYGPDDPDWR